MFIVTLHSALPATDGAPDWVHLVPAGTFSGADGRGPYRVRDAAAVIRQSMAAARLPIDENHAIDIKAPKGEPSPARGWIVEMQERSDGIWGRVEWTEAGRAMVAGKDYRGISPAISRAADGEIVAVLRASLTNTPNLTQLATLHHRSDSMNFLEQLRKLYGLADTVAEADVLAAVTAQKTAVDTHASQLAAIRAAAGLAADVAPDGIVTELQARQSTGDQAAAQLRSTVVDLQTQLTTLQADTAKREAARVIDEAIAAGKVGLVPLREHYIERHMADPAAVMKEIGAMVSLHASGRVIPSKPANGEVVLSAEEERTCELMGIDLKAYAEQRKALKMEVL
ncbi:phage protease [Ancylobacter pratisalsi]|uniref:Mu-like prophage I protein n=1 Tax=Ancylobacter pratisalsi TaxID=1745854 RepID=A0A6P1YNP7_9HYPH|nr:phage protease [Ancylobacter pratisalsi]QIB34755.1 hypothetical protein G3A50_14345 [Ancylobacter pratisalsi]